MGTRQIAAAVADSGPIIHLSEVGHIRLLRVFNTIHIPDAVWSETIERGRVNGQALLELGNAQRHTLSEEEIRQQVL